MQKCVISAGTLGFAEVIVFSIIEPVVLAENQGLRPKNPASVGYRKVGNGAII